MTITLLHPLQAKYNIFRRFGILALSILFLLLPHWTQAQGEADRYLGALEKKYSGLKDYVAGVRVHFDLETFKTPDVEAKLYFKAPDLMKVESKRVLFFPKEGGYFNPSLFKSEEYSAILQEHLTQNGKKAVKIRLVSKKPRKTIRDATITLDLERNQVKEVSVLRQGGGEIRAEITYGTFDRFDLPTRILLFLDFPAMEPELKGFAPSPQGAKRVTGRIELTYSSYQINSGLRDEIFREVASQQP